MDAIDYFLNPHAAAIALRQRRMELLGSNIANAATPNYKARDIDFASAYAQQTSSAAALTTTHAAHAVSAQGVAGAPLYRLPVSQSLDGNTVELHVEQIQFAENATRYEASIQMLNDRIRNLRSALRGE